MGNGHIERANRTIEGLLRRLNSNEKKKWLIHIDKIIHAYNNTSHCSTGYTPFYLMFLREDKLPIERILDTEETNNINWLDVNLSNMIQINRQAMDSLEEASKKRQKRYNLGKVEDLLVVEKVLE